MRIVLDLQGAQGANRFRGIGRYTRALSQAIVRNAGVHEVRLALNGLLEETVEPLRTEFEGLIPQDHIHVWAPVGPLRQDNNYGAWRSKASEGLREGFLASLQPDVVHICSLFEGRSDESVTSIGALTLTQPTSMTLYDLIPIVHRDLYLVDQSYEDWYERKLDHLRRAKLWLAISESTRQEAINYLGVPEEWVVNISGATDARFQPMTLSAEETQAMRQRYDLSRPYVMYTGGIDLRKNVEGLVRAYARLPEAVRRAHQLAIVCSVQPQERIVLERLASMQGLAPGELILTGYVPDEDLVKLYNLCEAFAFPSWHEGFGLPALEAMACGAPVIGAGTSSVPEVLGRQDALFDPHQDSSITAKLFEVLTDDAFRGDLRRHGLQQAKQFSWDQTARRAIGAMERLHAREQEERRAVISVPMPRRPRLAYVSPLPPERSGISDYSAELLPELSRHYEIDVVVDQTEVLDSWIRANCGIRNAEWFDTHASCYDRTIYHFGNSTFHQHMFDLLDRHPGVVVLHDFFLSGIVAHMDVHGAMPNVWAHALYHAHGYPAAQERFHTADTAEVVWAYPCNLDVLQQAVGLIVHSEFARELATDWYGPEFAKNWAVIPHPRAITSGVGRAAARQALGLSERDFIVCSFGLIGPIKMNDRLLAAWLSSPLAKDKTCHLIFVGENDVGDYGAKVLDAIRQSGDPSRIRITGFASSEQFRQYLNAADVGVQLRTRSRGETSGTVLDCMGNGLATIVNAHGSMAEIPEACIRKLPDDFRDGDLSSALADLWREKDARRGLGERARSYVRKNHAPHHVADKYMQAIEKAYRGPGAIRHRFVQSVTFGDGVPNPRDELAWLPLAEAMAVDFAVPHPRRTLFVDISKLVQNDAKTGIQRVVRSVLQRLLTNPPDGYRVEPVYTGTGQPYRYARRFTMKFLDCPDGVLNDETLEIQRGDIFLGLDLVPDSVPGNDPFFKRFREVGGEVYFLVYDILPVRHPEWFFPGAAEMFERWLETIAKQNGAICISRATANDLQAWVNDRQLGRHRPFKIGWFHSGSDIEASVPTTGLPPGFENALRCLRAQPSILMVGTLEPRKAHAQVLGAFERLWKQGMGVSLIIVGKPGWMVEELTSRLKDHPEAGHRLFWFQGVSDEALRRLYEVAKGVLVASRGEGFGLPVVEAAQHGRPVLVRDIPVFREVAGNGATYFSGDGPEDLANALRQWLKDIDCGVSTSASGVPRETWLATVQQIVGLITNPSNPNWLHRWNRMHGGGPASPEPDGTPVIGMTKMDIVNTRDHQD